MSAEVLTKEEAKYGANCSTCSAEHHEIQFTVSLQGIQTLFAEAKILIEVITYIKRPIKTDHSIDDLKWNSP